MTAYLALLDFAAVQTDRAHLSVQRQKLAPDGAPGYLAQGPPAGGCFHRDPAPERGKQ